MPKPKPEKDLDIKSSNHRTAAENVNQPFFNILKFEAALAARCKDYATVVREYFPPPISIHCSHFLPSPFLSKYSWSALPAPHPARWSGVAASCKLN